MFALGLVTSGAFAEPSADDPGRDRFVRATAAADAGDLATARLLYAEVWALRQTYDVAMNLAEVESHLELPAAAATHAAAALALLPPSEDPETRAHLEGILARSRSELAELDIEAPAGSRVRVNGELVGVAPLGWPVFVTPGPHQLEAVAAGGTRSGDARVQTSITAHAGERQRVELELSGGTGASASTSSLAPHDDSTDNPAAANGTTSDATEGAPAPGNEAVRHGARPSVAPLLVSASVTVLGASLGVGFALVAREARREASPLDSADDSRCAIDPSTADCRELAMARDRLDTNRSARDVSFVVAGAGLVATGVFALLRTREPAQAARWVPAATLTADSALLSVKRTF